MHVSNKIICVSVLEGLNLTTKIVQIKLYLMKALDHHDINLFVDFLFINQYYNSVIQKKKELIPCALVYFLQSQRQFRIIM